jgi:hypothetical protein
VINVEDTSMIVALNASMKKKTPPRKKRKAGFENEF